MAIYETATKLANEIKSSKEYTQFKKYMQEVKKDPESEKLLTEYKMTQVKVQNFTVNDQKDQKRNLAKFLVVCSTKGWRYFSGSKASQYKRLKTLVS